MTTLETFSEIKKLVLKVLPTAEVYLFGSRANGNWSEDSDWDVLIVSEEKISREIRKQVHDKLYPLSIQLGSFIHFILCGKYDWENNPAYYSLKLSISANPLIA